MVNPVTRGVRIEAKRMRYQLVDVAAIGLAVPVYDGMQVTRWVGRTNLTIKFIVTDARTGAAIEGAEILVSDEASSSNIDG